MTTRRDFLKRLTLTAAGLLVADDVLAMLVEPPRKLWPGADFSRHVPDGYRLMYDPRGLTGFIDFMETQTLHSIDGDFFVRALDWTRG